MHDKLPFSKEYQSASETKAEVPILSEVVPQDQIKIDTERYRMAKPKRIIIRAEITHDKDKKRTRTTMPR